MAVAGGARVAVAVGGLMFLSVAFLFGLGLFLLLAVLLDIDYHALFLRLLVLLPVSLLVAILLLSLFLLGLILVAAAHGAGAAGGGGGAAGGAADLLTPSLKNNIYLICINSGFRYFYNLHIHSAGPAQVVVHHDQFVHLDIIDWTAVCLPAVVWLTL